MENRLNRLNELEAAVGVRFNDRALLQRAFVHRSYLHEADEETELQDNQRLEFLGDAVLSFIVSELLFRRYPERREGDLTNLRSALVKRETLSRFAKELRLGDYLLLGRGEEENGGRGRHTTLCDTYEAFIGAFFLDQGTAALRKFVEPRLMAEIDRVAPHALTKDPKSRLQEWVQAAMGQTPSLQDRAYRRAGPCPTVHPSGDDRQTADWRRAGAEQTGGRTGRSSDGAVSPGADHSGVTKTADWLRNTNWRRWR